MTLYSYPRFQGWLLSNQKPIVAIPSFSIFHISQNKIYHWSRNVARSIFMKTFWLESLESVSRSQKLFHQTNDWQRYLVLLDENLSKLFTNGILQTYPWKYSWSENLLWIWQIRYLKRNTKQYITSVCLRFDLRCSRCLSSIIFLSV